jgi:hypothetical protein
MDVGFGDVQPHSMLSGKAVVFVLEPYVKTAKFVFVAKNA